MAEPRYDLVLRAERVVLPEGVRGAAIGVRDGRIAEVADVDAALMGNRKVELAAETVLLPGLVDTHVHVNEPGRTEWEGFASATRAAAAGGVTTIVDMPLNSVPPTTTVEALEAKRAAAREQAATDVGFWGGAVPGNTADLRPLHDAGVYGFKSFLSPSGVPEFGHLSPEEFRADMAAINEFGGLMIVHAEDPGVLGDAPAAGGNEYAGFLASRPDEAEHRAISLVIDAARRTGARAHILHLSSATALGLIAEAKAQGVALTVETCPHYLTLAAEQVPQGATQYKCCPPIRGEANRDALWEALAEGTIDDIVSDHSPSTPDLKDLDTGDFGTAWGGVSSLQVGLSAIWTEAERRGHALSDVVRWMAGRPAEIAGVHGKGRIGVGYDADFAVFAPDSAMRVDAAALQHKNPVSAYDGKELRGAVRESWLRGERVDPTHPHGRLLRRG